MWDNTTFCVHFKNFDTYDKHNITILQPIFYVTLSVSEPNP